jgi:hypothetical protein
MDLECLHCGACFWVHEYVMIYNLAGVLVFVTAGDSVGIAERQIWTREQCYGWSAVCIFAASRLQYVFGGEGTLLSLIWTSMA